jgi:hypothetical protein
VTVSSVPQSLGHWSDLQPWERMLARLNLGQLLLTFDADKANGRAQCEQILPYHSCVLPRTICILQHVAQNMHTHIYSKGLEGVWRGRLFHHGVEPVKSSSWAGRGFTSGEH